MTRRQVLLGLLIIELFVAFIVMFNFGYLSGRLQPTAPVDAANQTQAASTGKNAAPAAAVLIPELSPTMFTIFASLPPEATPGNYKLTDALINLGRMLWYDKRLSKSQQQNCNSCHLLDRYGVDSLPVSIGHDNKPVRRNAQSVYNAAFHVAQFWDGRAPTVEEQAKMPIMSQTEMSMKSPAQVEAVLRSIPGYVAAFTAAFPDDPNPVTFDHLAQAIGAFERRLVTPSRFDRFLAGDYGQLTPEEQRGLARFISTGCVTCHVGVTVGGLMFKRLGEVEPYQTADNGRFDITGLENDRHVFKVQSLRNIVKTGPYLHDGSIQTLQDMVRLMARYQLGKQLSDAEIAEIITFLNTLTGDIPTDYIATPVLPDNGPDTQLALQAQ